jgi:squalene-associated FAD-dependent desaturase
VTGNQQAGKQAVASRLTPYASRAELRVAVIGGGWAGMAAAVELAGAGAEVVVFEAARVLGGRARKVEVDGQWLDNGLHILVGAYAETVRLIQNVCRRGEALGFKRLRFTLQVEPDFRLHAPWLPAPLHLAAALATARGLSVTEKLAAARFLAEQKRRAFRCDPQWVVEAMLAAHDQPRRLVAAMWAPLCVAALNTRPAQASAQIFLNVLRDCLAGPRAASDLLLPTTDFSALFPDRARRYIEARRGFVRLNAAVKRIESAGNGFAVDGQPGFTHAVVAVAPHRLESVLAEHEAMEPALAQVRRLEYRPIHSVYLQYPERTRLPAPMIGLTGGFGHWAFDRGRLCGQPGMIGVVISGDGPHETLEHDALAGHIHSELAARWDLPQPRWWRVIAEKRATFACVPGLSRPSNRTAVPGLFLAGDYTESEYPATLEAAVRSGVAAARLVLQDSKTARPPTSPLPSPPASGRRG